MPRPGGPTIAWGCLCAAELLLIYALFLILSAGALPFDIEAPDAGAWHLIGFAVSALGMLVLLIDGLITLASLLGVWATSRYVFATPYWVRACLLGCFVFALFMALVLLKPPGRWTYPSACVALSVALLLLLVPKNCLLGLDGH